MKAIVMVSIGAVAMMFANVSILSNSWVSDSTDYQLLEKYR